ncbi:hypothetical protein BASA81_018041 [Batrachochytrium salamandrivorans]|nr:hypothetical protein BASA81_018041 [Batrachochytrium salamandrivorans]
MDPSKISAVQDWPAPKKILLATLTKLLKKDVPFSWGPEQEASFKKLKDAFAQPGFLAHPNDEQPFIWKQMLRTLPFLEFCISTTNEYS